MENEVQIIEASINSSLQKNNITEQVIADLQKFRDLTIGGITDREGYIKVDEARKQCKNLRILASKLCKAGREKAVAEQKAWISKEKEVTGKIEEIEIILENRTKEIDAENTRIKEEAKAKERLRIQSRIDELYKYGRAIDFSYVSSMNDAEFNLLLSEAKAEFEKEQEKLAEEKRQKEEAEKAERERMEKQKQEQEAERIRLEKLREEQEKKELEMKAEADRVRKEQEEAAEKIRIEQAERERKLREEYERIEKEKREFEERKAKEEEEKRRAEELEKAKTEAAEKAKREEAERIEREEKERIEKERIEKEENDRRLLMKSDKDRMAQLFLTIEASVNDCFSDFNTDGLQPETLATIPVIKSKFDEFTLWSASRISELK